MSEAIPPDASPQHPQPNTQETEPQPSFSYASATQPAQQAASSLDAAVAQPAEPLTVPANAVATPVVQSTAAASASPILHDLQLGTTWATAAKIAGTAYAAALAFAALSLTIGMTALANSTRSLPGVSSLPLPSFQPSAGSLLGGIFAFVAMAFGGTGSAAMTFMGAGIQGNLTFAPLFVTAAGLIGAWISSRRFAAVVHPLSVGIAAGLIFATGTSLLSILVPMQIVPGVDVRGASIFGWILATLLVGCVAAMGRGLNISATWRPALWTSGVAWCALLVVGLIGAIVILTRAPNAMSLLPLIGLNMGAAAAEFGLLGSVAVNGSPSGFSSGTSISMSLFSSGVPAEAFMLLIAAIVIAAAAAVILWLRGGAKNPADIARMAAVWAVIGIVLQLLTGVSMSYSAGLGQTSSYSNGDFGIGPALTNFFIVALWGAAIGALGIWLAPRIAGSLPAGFVNFARRGASTPLPQAPAATFVPATPSAAGNTAALMDGSVPTSAQTTQEASDAGDMFHPAVSNAGASVANTPDALPPIPPSKPMSPRAKLILLLAGAALLLMAIASAVLPIVRSQFFGPEAALREYTAAIESGDADKALALSGQTPDTKAQPLLTTAVYQKATHRPERFALGKAQIDGDRATIPVTYSQNGQEKSLTLGLSRVGTSWLIKDDWKLTTGIMPTAFGIELPTGTGDREISVNGTKLPGKYNTSFSKQVLPGTYSVAVDPTPLFNGANGNFTLTVGPEDNDSPDLSAAATPTDAFTKSVMDAENKHLAECAASTKAYNENCPFTAASEYSADYYKNVSYKITKQPGLELVKNSSTSTTGANWQVRSTDYGTVTINSTYTSGMYTSSPTSNSNTFSVDDGILLDGANNVTIAKK